MWDPHTETCPSRTPGPGRGDLRFRVRVRVRAGFFPETHNFHRVIPKCPLVKGLMDTILSLVNSFRFISSNGLLPMRFSSALLSNKGSRFSFCSLLPLFSYLSYFALCLVLSLSKSKSIRASPGISIRNLKSWI